MAALEGTLPWGRGVRTRLGGVFFVEAHGEGATNDSLRSTRTRTDVSDGEGITAVLLQPLRGAARVYSCESLACSAFAAACRRGCDLRYRGRTSSLCHQNRWPKPCSGSAQRMETKQRSGRQGNGSAERLLRSGS